MAQRINHFYPTTPSKVRIDSPPGIVPARVVDIVLSENHPSFTSYGDIGMIRYRVVGSSSTESKMSQLGVAYPISRNMMTFPLLEEIVFLQIGPISQEQTSTSDTSRVYYNTPLSIWNHPHWNPHPDSEIKEYPKADPDGNFIDSPILAPLLPFPGDTLIESRFGSSIRFTGAKSPNNPYILEKRSGDEILETNNGKALTIIRNGQKVTGDGYTSTLEDINEDATSIYLTEQHQIPLSGSTEDGISMIGASFIDSDQDDPEAKLIVPPEELNIYSGSQAIINSDRVVLNSKQDSVLISGNEAIGLSANSVNIDGRGDGSKVVISAQQIYIGLNALRLRNASKGSSAARINEPAVLGRTYVTLQKDLIQALFTLTEAIATPHLPATWVPNVTAAAASIKAELKRLHNQQETALSENVFLEPNLRNRRV